MFYIDKESIQISKNAVHVIGEDSETEIATRPGVIALSDFRRNFLLKNTINQNIIYPKGCRFIRKTGDSQITLVFEEEPMIRKILCESNLYQFNVLDYKKESKLVKNIRATNQIEYLNIDVEDHLSSMHYFTLAFPYVVYIIILNEVKTNKSEPTYVFEQINVFFKFSPIESFYDKLMLPNLGNVFVPECKICMCKNKEQQNLSDVCYTTINKFWQSRFNDDLNRALEKYHNSDSEIKNYFEWEYRTKENPSFILNAKLIETEFKLGNIINPSDQRLGFKDDYQIFSEMKNIVSLGSQYGTENAEIKSILKMSSLTIGGHRIEVGDCIYLKEKRYYVNSIYATKQIEGDIRFIIESEKSDKKYNVKLTEKFVMYLINQLKKRNEFNQLEHNGYIIKKDDILNIKGMFYGKVEKIKRTKDDKIEIRINSHNFLYETVKDDIEIFDQYNFTVGDIKLDQNKIYGIFKKTDNLITPYKSNYTNENIYTFKYADPYEGKINLRFEDLEEEYKNIYADQIYKYLILEQKDIKYKAEVNILAHLDYIAKIELLEMNEYIIKTSEFESFVRNPSNNCYPDLNFTIGSFIDNIYNKEEGKVKIKRYGESDVEFNIGESIIFVNDFYGDKRPHLFGEHGKDIHELKFKKYEITGFSYNDLFFYFDVVDEDRINHHIPYIKIDKGRNIVNNYLGIRKVIYEYDDFKIGDKIQCNVARVAGFPKKDINRIEAIIPISNGDPLILCSNFCTIKGGELFSNFVKKDKPISDIPIGLFKMQPGDLVFHYGSIHYISQRNSDNYHKTRYYDDTIQLNYSYASERNIYSTQLIGIPLPRIKVGEMKDLTDTMNYNGFVPNSEGTLVNKTNYKFDS